MLSAPCEIHLPPALPRRTSFRLRRVFDYDSAAALFLRWNRTTPHLRSRTRAQGPSRLTRPVPGLVAFHGKWAFYYLGGGAVRVSSQAKQSLYSSLATLLWHRGPVTKSVTRANLARAAGPAAHAQRVPIAVGGRIRIPQESFPTGAGVGTGLPSRSPATPSLVPGWKAGGWSSRQIHQPGAVRTL